MMKIILSSTLKIFCGLQLRLIFSLELSKLESFMKADDVNNLILHTELHADCHSAYYLMPSLFPLYMFFMTVSPNKDFPFIL